MIKAKGNTSVLIVDGEPERRAAYVVLLESLDIAAVQADSADAALGRLGEADFAAVLLDGRPSVTNGIDTAHRIRSHPRGRNTPIIFITDANVTERHLLSACAMEAVDRVRAPVLPDVLRTRFGAPVQLRRQLLEMSQLNDQLISAHAELAKMHRQLQADDDTPVARRLNECLARLADRLQREIADRGRSQRLLTDAPQSNEALGCALTHELRNPLSAIQSGIELIRLPSLPSEELAWARELVERQFRLLATIVDDLLDVSYVARGRVELRKEVVDLGAIMAESIASTRAQIDQRRHKVSLRLQDEPLYVTGDSARLRQVFTNLLAAASRHMAPKGRIEVVAAPLAGEPPRLAVYVRGEGHGLEAGVPEATFDRCARTESNGRRSPGSLGIGLALARGLVDLHGGTVRARSEGFDREAKFTVELPRAIPGRAAPLSARQHP